MKNSYLCKNKEAAATRLECNVLLPKKGSNIFYSQRPSNFDNTFAIEEEIKQFNLLNKKHKVVGLF